MDIPQNEPLIEKARINMKESGSEIFPFENWVLQIWSNDHNPPHFHVKCDGWDICCSIDDGRILEVIIPMLHTAYTDKQGKRYADLGTNP